MKQHLSKPTYAPFSGPITLDNLDNLFAHHTSRFGGFQMVEGDDDWSTVFEGQTPAQVKQALEDAQAAGNGDNPWAEVFKDETPEDVKKRLEESRKWETRAKGNKAKADQFDSLAKLITGDDGDNDPDPEKLAGDLTAAQRESRATRIENAVLRAAATHEANPLKLTDSRSFMSTLDDLDPTATDFATKVSDAIKTAVEKDETFKLGTTTATRGPRPTRQQGRPSEGQDKGSVQSGRDAYSKRHGKTS